jgi:hypothetical protein
VDRERAPDGGNSSWNPVARAFHPESLPALGEVPGLVSPDLPGLLVPAHPAGGDVETARWKRASSHPAPEQRLVFLGSGAKISRNRISFVKTKPSRSRNFLSHRVLTRRESCHKALVVLGMASFILYIVIVFARLH